MSAVASRLLAVCALVAAAACTGGGSEAGARFDASRRGTAGPASAKPTYAIKLPATLPPATMFVGSASHRTAPSRYCAGGECATLSPSAPPALEGPAGVAVFFGLTASPVSARLDVAGAGSLGPASVALSPHSSMAWQASLPQGAYRLTLVAAYADAEVSWPFALRIVPPKKAS